MIKNLLFVTALCKLGFIFLGTPKRLRRIGYWNLINARRAREISSIYIAYYDSLTVLGWVYE